MLADAEAEFPSHINDNVFVNVRGEMDSAFSTWIQHRYAGLHNQPAIPPVMLHHVPRALARRLETSPGRKIALLVLDGLALDQWLVIRQVLCEQNPELVFHDHAVFAWAPTILLFPGRQSLPAKHHCISLPVSPRPTKNTLCGINSGQIKA